MNENKPTCPRHPAVTIQRTGRASFCVECNKVVALRWPGK